MQEETYAGFGQFPAQQSGDEHQLLVVNPDQVSTLVVVSD